MATATPMVGKRKALVTPRQKSSHPINEFLSYNDFVNITADTSALPQSRKMLILLGLLLALFLADGVITRFLVANGLGIEGNPFLGAWVTTDEFAWVKLAGGLLACLLCGTFTGAWGARR